ncbi:MAG: helix-turn-helix domain-containing protein [Blastocatellia bacterium]|nr:helix-turn-helix domain-containing protein [Blastocatellia bacterium]
MNENFRLISVEEAAPKLGRSKQGLYRDIREKQFPFPGAVVKFGKTLRINLDLIEKTMEQQTGAQESRGAAV